MADVLSGVRSDLEKRLRELEPLIEEHAQVRQALDALNGAGLRMRTVGKAAPARRSPAPDTGDTASRRGRPRGTSARAQEAMRLIHRQPGISVAEMAKRMKIKPHYLYGLLPGLEKEGGIVKRDKGYHLTAT